MAVDRQNICQEHTRVRARCGGGGVTGGNSAVLVVRQILLSVGGPASVTSAAAVGCGGAVRAAVGVAKAALHESQGTTMRSAERCRGPQRGLSACKLGEEGQEGGEGPNRGGFAFVSGVQWCEPFCLMKCAHCVSVWS